MVLHISRGSSASRRHDVGIGMDNKEYAVPGRSQADLTSKALFHVCTNLLSTTVHPYNCIVKGLAACFIPDDRSFTLICDANGLDIEHSVFLLCCLDSLLYTFLHSLPYLCRIMLYPAAGSRAQLTQVIYLGDKLARTRHVPGPFSMLSEFHMVAGYRMCLTVV